MDMERTVNVPLDVFEKIYRALELTNSGSMTEKDMAEVIDLEASLWSQVRQIALDTPGLREVDLAAGSSPPE